MRSLVASQAVKSAGLDFHLNISNLNDVKIDVKIPMSDCSVDIAAEARQSGMYRAANFSASSGFNRLVRGTLHKVFDCRPEIANKLSGTDGSKKYTELPRAFRTGLKQLIVDAAGMSPEDYKLVAVQLEDIITKQCTGYFTDVRRYENNPQLLSRKKKSYVKQPESKILAKSEKAAGPSPKSRKQALKELVTNSGITFKKNDRYLIPKKETIE
ncbi:hypothetical protein PMAYCL1PPCAC_23160, partial [Pristionchus mayeri]